MMQKRRFKALAMVLALGIVAAGCGGDDADETDGDGGSDGDTPEEVTGPPTVTLEEECEAAKAEGVTAPDGFQVKLVTDIGRVDDGTFNQFAYEGMEAAKDCFDFESSYIETVSEADYATNISTTLQANPNVVITNGFLIADATLAAAQANTDVSFIGVDQFQEEFPENYVGVQFREDQGGFMAGVLAASLSQSGVIGVVGGREDVPPVVRLVNAYETGAKSVNSEIRVLKVYNESFTAPDKGASDAAQFIGEGADVIFGAGGQTGSGGIAAAAEQGVWAIGVDQDEYFTTFNSGDTPGSDKLATSAVKRVDLAVFRNIVAAMKGEFAGGLFTLDAENDGITYAPFHDAELPDEAIAAVEEARAGLADGSVDTGVDPVSGLPN